MKGTDLWPLAWATLFICVAAYYIVHDNNVKDGSQRIVGPRPTGRRVQFSMGDEVMHSTVPQASPLAEWYEEIGPVLWWKFPIEEPPYCGTPNDLGYDVLAETTVATFRREESRSVNFMVGGWPGYHTHWTPIQIPEEPK